MAQVIRPTGTAQRDRQPGCLLRTVIHNRKTGPRHLSPGAGVLNLRGLLECSTVRSGSYLVFPPRQLFLRERSSNHQVSRRAVTRLSHPVSYFTVSAIPTGRHPADRYPAAQLFLRAQCPPRRQIHFFIHDGPPLIILALSPGYGNFHFGDVVLDVHTQWNDG